MFLYVFINGNEVLQLLRWLNARIKYVSQRNQLQAIYYCALFTQIWYWATDINIGGKCSPVNVNPLLYLSELLRYYEYRIGWCSTLLIRKKFIFHIEEPRMHNQ